MKNNKRGFTLIEIVMVLVLLGILAAVAIPKYYDLKETAQKRAAEAVAAEYQARLNAKFAEQLMSKDAQGVSITCQKAREAGIKEANKLNAEVKDFTIEGLKEDGTVAGGIHKLKINSVEEYQVSVPLCGTETYTAPTTGTGS